MTTTADSAAGVLADDEFPSPELLPHYEIQMDWQAYDRLPPDEQGKFVVIMKSLEQERWIGQREFSPLEWACIDLSEYANHDDFIAAIKKQGGAAFRQGRKAEERGFYSKFFDERTFIADIVDINCSAPERQGQPMRDSFLLTVDQRGGYPAQFYPPEIPPEHVLGPEVRDVSGSPRPSAGIRGCRRAARVVSLHPAVRRFRLLQSHPRS
jgi:hypothetical protein